LAVAAAAALTVPIAALTSSAGASPPRESGPGQPVASPRVWSLIGQMTLDEKLSFVYLHADPTGVAGAGYIPGVPRLGIPPLRFTDSPDGIRISQPATALPAPVALASSFDDRLAYLYGRTVGREGRALGQDVLLAPMTNIIRVPQGGRNFETFSEDPLVSSHMTAADVSGVQSAGLIATVKHYAENNQENNRMNVDVNVDEQTLHEVELPAFQAAVDAEVGAVMCSYNLVNGVHSCSNDDLLNGILKAQWGFQGWVMSDYGATHATSDISHGLDQDMFNVGIQNNTFFSTDLKTAIQSGSIPMSTLDNAVARILGQMQRFGLLNGADTRRPALDLTADAAVAQQVAEDGAVLLKNTDHALPLTAKNTSIALIGPAAQTPKITGGGSAEVTPASAASPLQTITARAGTHTTVTYTAGVNSVGTPIPASTLTPTPTFDTAGSTVQPGAPLSYTGTLTIPADGNYTFSFAMPGGLATLSIDGTGVATAINGTQNADVQLTAGPHTISLLAQTFFAPGTYHLNWITPDLAATARAAAVAAAEQADTPIVFASDGLTEGSDRTSLTLPASQDQLIDAVATANPNTIVVLDTGSSITMPWLPKVKAVLDMYYPGENGAQATARLLYGDANPSGKLTQTFPTSQNVTPIAGNPETYPGVNNEETYSEGIYVGYKWYDKTGNTPLFPFGYGLSYTQFAYRHLQVTTHGNTATISFLLTNTGHRAGQEVTQAYAGPSPQVTEPQALRTLVGYQKVALQPGETKQVTITVPAQQFKYWNTTSHAWQLGTGTRTLAVGSSSTNQPLTTTVTIH
jgi:beta-glucosidase